MKLTEQHLTLVKWTARTLAPAVLLLGVPFYVGYGNPLPFANPENSFFDNLWLSALPLMFIGLVLGWKWEKTGGYLIVIPVLAATVIGVATMREGLPGPMIIPLIAGMLYLFVGYKKVKAGLKT